MNPEQFEQLIIELGRINFMLNTIWLLGFCAVLWLILIWWEIKK